MPSEAKAKAYKASAMDMDRGCCIVWAETAGKARALAASELDVTFTEIDSLTRVRELDDFDGDLLQWQLDDGWSWECNSIKCYQQVYGDSFVRVGENLYCCQEHADAEEARAMAQHEQAATDKEALTARALELRPGSIVDDAYMNPYGGVVSLTLPSGRHVTTNLDWLASEEGQRA